MNLQEINNLIADKVMNWKLKEMFHGDFWIDENEGWHLKQLWKPTTNIDDAWLVAEKFEYIDIEKNAGHYYCALMNEQFYQGDASRAPLAICIAALKSVGVEVEG